jgi:hypothetical protein
VTTTQRWRVPELLFQSVLIVLSIALGFAVTQWQDRRRDAALAAEATANFRREVQQNLRLLVRVQPKHATLVERLRQEAATPHPGETAFDALVRVRHEIDSTDVPVLSDAAWETATGTGALRLLGYERAARLSETYLIQRGQLVQTLLRIEERASAPESFTPASREAMLRVYALLFAEVEGGERYLIGVYGETLKQLGTPASAR